MEPAFLFASALLLVGLVLRAKVAVLQVFYVPAAIIGGLIGLVLLQHAQVAGPMESAWIAGHAAAISDELASWPGWLIAVVFTGLFLDKPGRSLRESLHGAVREGNMVWIICLGQVGWACLPPGW